MNVNTTENAAENGGRMSSGPASPQFEAIHPATSSNSHPTPITSSTEQHHTGRRYSDVSSLSSRSDINASERGRTAGGLSPVSTGTGMDFDEATEEGKDHFDEGLAPPPTFTSLEASRGRKGSPKGESRFREVGI